MSVEQLILSNLRRTQAFDRNLRANAGIEKIAAGLVDAILYTPDGGARTKAIRALQTEFFEHARDVALPQAERIGRTNAGDIIAKIPEIKTKPSAADLRSALFEGKRRNDERLAIIKSAISQAGNSLDERLTRYWLEPAEGGREEKLKRLREIHNRLENRRKSYEERYREFTEGKIKSRPSKPDLDFMSATTSAAKQEIRVQARRAGTDAETRLFVERGAKQFAWIAVNAGIACPDCALRQAVVLPLSEWERLGRPGSGETICGDNCFCMLVPAETLSVSSSLATAANLKANAGVLTTSEQRAIFDKHRRARSGDSPKTTITTTPTAAEKKVEIPPETAPPKSDAEKIREIFGDSYAHPELMDDPYVKENLADLAKFPEPLLRALKEKNVVMAFHKSPVTKSIPHLKGVTPRGYEGTGQTWDDVAGAYNPDGKLVVVGKAGPHGAESIAAHETGHALGDVFGYNHSLQLDDAHKRLFDKLHPYAKQGGPGGVAGRQEMLAMSVEAMIKRGFAETVKSYDQPFAEFLRDIVMKGRSPFDEKGQAAK